MSRILVIRGGALGDFLLTLPAIRLLHEGLDADVEILGYEPFLGLAKDACLATATRSMEHAALSLFFVPGAELDEEWQAYFAGFSVVISYLYDPDDYFADNLEKAGVETLIRGIHKPLNAGLHAVAQLAAPLETLALFLDEEDRGIVLELGSEAPSAPSTKRSAPRIAFHPGSGSPSKNWDLDEWTRLALLLQEQRSDLELLLVTGEVEEEHGIADHVSGIWKQRSIRFEHLRAQPLRQVADALSATDLFVGQDSGVTHLASVLGIPTVVLFGPTNPEVWAPPHKATRVLRAPGGQLGQLPAESVLEEILRHPAMVSLSESAES